MIHEVVPRQGGDDDERLPRTVSATTLRVRGGGLETGQRIGAATAGSRTGERIGCSRRGVHYLAELMIVPAIGIVVEHDQRGVGPLRLGLQEVGHSNHKLLLIER